MIADWLAMIKELQLHTRCLIATAVAAAAYHYYYYHHYHYYYDYDYHQQLAQQH